MDNRHESSTACVGRQIRASITSRNSMSTCLTLRHKADSARADWTVYRTRGDRRGTTGEPPPGGGAERIRCEPPHGVPAAEPKRHARAAPHGRGGQGIRLYGLRAEQSTVHGDGSTGRETPREGGFGGTSQPGTGGADDENCCAAAQDDRLHARRGGVGTAFCAKTAGAPPGQCGARTKQGYGESCGRAASAARADSCAAVGARSGV